MNGPAMTTHEAFYLHYALQHGFIEHWLAVAVTAPPAGEPQPPATRPCHLTPFDEREGAPPWQYLRAAEDHFLRPGNLATAPQPGLWLYARLTSTRAATATAAITAHGRATLWLNGERVDHHHAEPPTSLASSRCALPLRAGANDLFIHCTQPAPSAQRWRLALRLNGEAVDAMSVELPIGADYAHRFQAYSALFDQASTDRDCFVGAEMIAIHWPDTLPTSLPLTLRLQNPAAQIYAETLGSARAGDATKTLAAQRVPTGAYDAVLMPPAHDYAQRGVRVRRALPLTVLSEAPQQIGDQPYLTRLASSLQQIMRRRQGLPSELAAMALGAWRYVNPAVVETALEAVRQRAPGHTRTVLALLGVAEHYMRQPAFPAALRPLIDARLRQFDYAMEEEETESTALMLRTAQIVAGQRYPAHTLGTDGRNGSQIRREAETATRAWLIERGCYGFQTMLDDAQFDELVFALSRLHALAQDQAIRELAAISLDKLCFSMGLHVFEGVGPGGLLGPSAALGRVLWGEGVCNLHAWGVIGLADSGYTLPAQLAQVATERAQPQWLHEYHRNAEGQWVIQRSTYRTPAYLLTSVSDATTPALRDCHQRWQATLGPAATIFVNHPAHMGAEPGDLPNFWLGDGSAPRLAHWKETLIALYRLPADDWLGFTHAYLPRHAFDETLLRENWLFARHGQAYIGLTASAPLTWVASGPGAHRELRAVGREVAWLCQLGAASEHGSFSDFCARLLAQPPSLLAPDLVDYTNFHGERIEFGWAQPMRVDGAVQRPDPALHYATPYCTVGFPAELTNIQLGDQLLQLDFSPGPTGSEAV